MSGAITYKARVWERATVTGTGSVTLLNVAQVGPFQTFLSAVPPGSQVTYCIVDAIANVWELGVGVFTINPETLTRKVLESSTGALINFPGNVCDVTLDIASPIIVSAGVSNAGMVPALSSTGKLDFSFLKTAVLGGTAAATTLPLTNAVGLIDLSFLDAVAIGGTQAAIGALPVLNGQGKFDLSFYLLNVIGGITSSQNAVQYNKRTLIGANGETLFEMTSTGIPLYDETDTYGVVGQYRDADGSVHATGTSNTAAGILTNTIPDATLGYSQIDTDSYGVVKTTFALDGSPVFGGITATFAGISISPVSGFLQLDQDIYGGLGPNYILKDGSPIFGGATATIGGITLTAISSNEYTDTDSFGVVIRQHWAVGTSPVFSPEETAATDYAASIASALIRSQQNTTAQRPSFNLNWIVVTGESPSAGNQCSPCLTTTQPFDTKMLGSVPGSSNIGFNDGTHFHVSGSSVLNPAISVDQNGVSGAIVTSLIHRGGFQGVVGGVFDPNGTTFTVTNGVGTMVTLAADGVTLVYTLVGGAGQAPFDFTQVFQNGDFINFYDLSGQFVTGLNNQQYPLNQASGVTANVLKISGVTFASAGTLVTTATVSMNIYRVNNNSYQGQEEGVPAANSLRNKLLVSRQVESDNRALAIQNSAVGGTTIAQWNSTFSEKTIDGATQAEAACAAASETSGIIAVTIGLGSNDNVANTSGPSFLAGLTQLVETFQTTLPGVFPNQKRRPIILVYQVSCQGADADSKNLAISMVQLNNFGLNPPNPDCYCAGPFYYATNQENMNSPHLLPNGEVWRGEMAAKIAGRILIDNQGWKPMHVTAVLYRGNTVRVVFHVPNPPLQIIPVYVGTTLTLFPDAGFTVYDSAGNLLSILSAAQPLLPDGSPAQFIIDLVVSETLTAAPTVWLGDNTYHANHTNVFDSDPTLSYNVYSYTDFGGQVPNENIPALNGLPFPLFNPACVGIYTATLSVSPAI